MLRQVQHDNCVTSVVIMAVVISGIIGVKKIRLLSGANNNRDIVSQSYTKIAQGYAKY